MQKPTLGIVIPTLNGIRYLSHTLPLLMASQHHPRCAIIDSGSTDGTIDLAHSSGWEVLTVPCGTFNHGETRERARRYLATDLLVMLTQDASPATTSSTDQLIAPLLSGRAAVAYGRQLPREQASVCEQFHRQFYYPDVSELRSIEDLSRLGRRLFCCSNAFAAYDNRALDQVGGFPSVLFGEDTIVAARLLRQGYQIAYVADATVYHSHEDSLQQQLRRHFDIGHVRREQRRLLRAPRGDKEIASSYVLGLLSYLWQRHPALLPYGVALIGAKSLGYLLGSYSGLLPRRLAAHLSSCPSYWRSQVGNPP